MLAELALHHASADEVFEERGGSEAGSGIGELYHCQLTAANGAAPVWQDVITPHDTGTPNTHHAVR